MRKERISERVKEQIRRKLYLCVRRDEDEDDQNKEPKRVKNKEEPRDALWGLQILASLFVAFPCTNLPTQ